MPARRHFDYLPPRIARLPRDARGFPIPKFVHWIDGAPDFRIISPTHMDHCVRHNACWICGETLGKFKVFVAGPMCCVNRINSEPPSHRECAEFAVRYCPFLAMPSARRREKDMPEDKIVVGEMVEHNPGVTCMWTTKTYALQRIDHGYLIQMGEPVTGLEFYARGRPARLGEVAEGLAKGMPFLQNAAAKQGPEAQLELLQMLHRFALLLDKAYPREVEGPPSAAPE